MLRVVHSGDWACLVKDGIIIKESSRLIDVLVKEVVCVDYIPDEYGPDGNSEFERFYHNALLRKKKRKRF